MNRFEVIDRRSMLVASASLLAGLPLGSPQLLGSPVPEPKANAGQAKSVILFFLCGGASHIDTWDMKPDAPVEYRGPFASIATPAPEIRL